MSSPRPTIVNISLKALRENLRQVRKLVGAEREIFAVVKANAYGHGAVEVARALQEEEVHYFGVATAEEGAELRQQGVIESITVLGGLFPKQFDQVVEYDLTPTLYNIPWAEELSKMAVRTGRTIPVQLKVDTGMGRLGFSTKEAPEKISEITHLPGLQILGIFSHFAFADLSQAEVVQAQLKSFSALKDLLQQKGIEIPFWHLSNSAAVMSFPPALFNMVRPGIMLYGWNPSDTFSERTEITPVLSWKTRIIHLKEVPSGTPLSYDHTFITHRPSRIATLPVGYADGYSRHFSNRAEVLVQGRRAPVVGRVTMDMTLIDVTDIDGVELGDPVVLLGEEAGDRITAWDLAAWSDSIAYEILCGIRRRVPRIYDDSPPRSL